jgi:TusA-related sulfurtransferase
MKKLTRADIRGPKLYEAIRDDVRKHVIAVKRLRRVSVGPLVSIVFENRATMIAQVEEMCRAEGLHEADKIQEEIDVYNAVLPNEGQLAATLFVEITDEAEIERTLNRLIGLQDHVWLIVGGERIAAEFDPEQFAADKLAAVQYLRFSLSPAAQKALRASGSAVGVAIDHPNYRHEARLGEESRASLAADLD